MSAIGIVVPQHANFVTPFSSPGRQAVGQENVDAKEELLAPVEQSAQSARSDKRDRAEVIDPDQREREAQKRAQQQRQEQELQQIARLAARDREVKAHERAHASVGGQLAGAPAFEYQRGPDGVSYAVAGEVPISLPRISGNPELVLKIAEQVRRAALAPAEPSEQDRQVAAQAAQIARQAAAELQDLQQREQEAAREQALAEAEQRREAREQAREQARLKEEQAQQALGEGQLLRGSVRRAEQLVDSASRLDIALGVLLDRRA